MGEEPAHIVVRIDTSQPIDLVDFVGLFSGLSSQYEKYIRASRPDLERDARIFVREIRPGSIVADLVPMALTALVTNMDRILIVDQFVRQYGARLQAYLRGGRDDSANKSDLRDLIQGVTAIATDPNAFAQLEAVTFEDGERRIRTSLKFSTPEAREALTQIQAHRAMLDATERADHVRVMMYFKRSDIGDASVGRRSGERVVIESISEVDRPLVYASQLAEERIKHEIRAPGENVFDKLFVVDVNVQTRDGRPIAYAVTNVHQVILTEPGD